MNYYDITNNYNDELGINIEPFMDYCLNKLNLYNCIFNIIFVDNKSIHKINKEYRKIDKITDVISFALEDNDKDFKVNNMRILGDIYISVDKAIEQANEYKHSLKREISFLAIHGLLHLLGYDHMNEADEKVMFGLQKELLDGFKITRG